MNKIIHKSKFYFLTLLWLVVATLAGAQTITGSGSVCVGSSIALTGAPVGGTWASSSSAIAMVDSTGTVTGITAGTATISYITGSGYTTQVVTVNPAPAAITGTASICQGAATTLSCATTGGTWISGTTTVASVGSTTGVVTGVSTGISTITYKLSSGCMSSKVVTVNSQPVITGTATFCAGTTTTLSTALSGGTWSISAGIAYFPSPSSGALVGLSAGMAAVTYVSPAGCMDTALAQVLAGPAAISGVSSICTGATTTLTDATIGGTWISSNPIIATIGSSTGVLTSGSTGVATISYTLATGCYVTKTITVNTSPTYTGIPVVCVGSTTSLSGGCGGWFGSSSIATIDSYGTVTGLTVGTATVTFMSCSGCSVLAVVTVNPNATISGTASLCVGGTAGFSASVTSGTWVSSNSSVATVGASSGVVSAVGAGTATISYTTPSGCVSTQLVTVSATASAGTVSGTSVCAGNTTTLSSTVGGGAWTSSTPAVATITSAGGVVTGLAAGTAIITYTVSGGCGTATATTVVTVNASATITGASPACVGLTSTLLSTASCGTWSSSNTAVASVSGTLPASAIVTGVAAGTATISLSLCSGCVVTYMVTIESSPAPISGLHSVCIGSSLALSDTTTGGAWTSSNPSVATIATIGLTPGVVTGVGAGVATMTYSMGPGCTTTFTMTINPLPVITASASSTGCGGSYLATATGGVSYSWAPSAGVSCGSCASTTIIPGGATIYTVTGVNSFGCSATDTVDVGSNRIFGHISFSGAMPSVTTCKVWLTHFDPTDSSIIAVDSTTTCVDSIQPYYQFTGVPAGDYMVKAQLLSSVPGSSGYYPMYGYSSPYWDGATVITHSTAIDSQDINMISGTVLSGPGFISGFVYEGAGKGTSLLAPVSGMLVFVKNTTTGAIINYTYTDSNGMYGFSNLPYGTYTIYPEEFDYYTTPWTPIVITPTTTSFTMKNFKKHTNLGTITPYDSSILNTSIIQSGMATYRMYPNPSNGVVQIELGNSAVNRLSVTARDIAGRVVYDRMEGNFNGRQLAVDLSYLDNGLYFVTSVVDGITHTDKLVIQKQ